MLQLFSAGLTYIYVFYQVAFQFIEVQVNKPPGPAAITAEKNIPAHDQQQLMPREDDIGEREQLSQQE